MPNATRQNKRGGIELDALLTNGDTVGILEVKSTLHKDDVGTVHDIKIEKFRSFFHEYADKKLLVMVAGDLINPDALELAHQHGFVCLTPNNQKLAIDTSHARVY